MKKLIATGVLALLPLSAFADHDAGCGVGTHLMAGKTGVLPKLLATYTNGILGNGTFGISSGTLGCDGRDAVQPNPKKAFKVFGMNNLDQLATEMASGEGEALDTMANLYGIQPADRPAFASLVKTNFSVIFPNDAVTVDAVVDSLNTLMAADQQLSRYAI